MKRLILNFLFLCLLNSCGYSQQKKDPTWVTEGREAFNKQEHRLEFRGCEIYYNGERVYLNQHYSELTKVFGPYNRRNDTLTASRVFVWDDIGIRGYSPSGMIDDPIRDSISTLQVFFKFTQKKKEDDEELALIYPKNRSNIILAEGIPVQSGAMLQDVLDASETLRKGNYKGVFSDQKVNYTDCEGHNTKYLKYIFDYPNYLSLGVENEGYLKEGEILSFIVNATDSGLK